MPPSQARWQNSRLPTLRPPSNRRRPARRLPKIKLLEGQLSSSRNTGTRRNTPEHAGTRPEDANRNTRPRHPGEPEAGTSARPLPEHQRRNIRESGVSHCAGGMRVVMRAVCACGRYAVRGYASGMRLLCWL
jgi:hypothetical protein